MVLLILHSIIRWIIVLVALLALGNNLTGWIQQKSYTTRDSQIMSIFIGLLDLQLILGMFLLFTGTMTQANIFHSVVLILTVTIAHVHVQWHKKDPKIKFRNNTLLILFILFFIYIAVAAL